MPKLASQWTCLSVFVVTLLPLQACAIPLTYSAKPIEGRVVDAETKAPIAGAVIVADWVLMVAGGGDRVRSLQTIETVTDQDGHYAIPGWGPKLRPTGVELTDSDPKLIVFKSTYVPEFLYNKHEGSTSVRTSDWDGKTIALKPFIGPPNKRVDQLNLVVDSCLDHTVPLTKLYHELAKERPLIEQAGKGRFVGAEDLKR
jgi:hypothetical protein